MFMNAKINEPLLQRISHAKFSSIIQAKDCKWWHNAHSTNEHLVVVSFEKKWAHIVTIVHSFYLLWPSSAWVIIFPHYLYQKWLLFSLNCNSVLLNTLAQAFWLDHYKKKPPLFTFPVISSASKRLYIGVIALYLYYQNI